MNDLAPIVLFVYNRPWHTRQCLESLEKNELASESVLYIYADGPKENSTEEPRVLGAKIKEVRELIREKKWCKEVHIIESAKNKGIGNSVIDGVTEIVNKYGKIIVLEDDLVLAKGFLRYMNDGLSLYENEEKVFGCSGYMFPVKKKLPETFFLYGGNNPWGWATWKRAWDKYNDNAQELYDKLLLIPNKISTFNFDNSFDYLQMLKDDIHKDKDRNWDIRWYATVFLAGGYGLCPRKSLVQNIGHDHSGVHCGNINHYHIKKLSEEIIVAKIPIEESKMDRKKIIKFYTKINNKTLLQKVKHKIKFFYKILMK